MIAAPRPAGHGLPRVQRRMHRAPASLLAARGAEHERGFTLAEVLVAVAIMGIVLLAAATLFAFAIRESATGGDLGSVGAVATDRMELLRANDFYALTAGGNLGSNVTGYSDASDPRFTVRWQIVDNANPVTLKTISVRVIAVRRTTGNQKEITLTTLRAR